MKRTLIFLALVMTLTTGHGQRPDDSRVLVAVKRNYTIPATEKAFLAFDWNELVTRLPSLKASNLKVTDQHFGAEIPAKVAAGKDGKPIQLLIDYTFNSTEPVFAFKISTEGSGTSFTTEKPLVNDEKFGITYLVPFTETGNNGKSIAQKIVESTLHTYPNPKDLSIISPGKWTYEYGFFLNATFREWEQTKDPQYLNYLKQWVEGFIGPDGLKSSEYKVDEYRLDDILPGRLCIYLYQQTSDEKYKKVADQLIEHLSHQPKTSEGGYWHKKIYPNQMWLDGIYMGDVFSVQYASTFNQAKWFDEAALQIKLIYKHASDPKTGLLYHGWDESKNKVWADQTRGTSPEFWSRAIGWYAMALVESLDYIPMDHPDRKTIEEIFRKLCTSIRNYQDKNSALWFQVIDKGNLKDNWIETSGSAMFTYAFAKGFHKGLLDKSFGTSAESAYQSLLKNYLYMDKTGDVHFDETVKVGSLNLKNSKGDYAYYISCERRLDDYKGLAALLYASMELKK